MIVLDASALVEVLVGGPSAGWVLEVIAGHDVRAPGHQPAEVLSALARLVRAGSLTASDALAAAADLSSLPQEHVAPTGVHLRRALELDGRLRVLDGLYVALAEELSCPLVTVDHRLARASPPCDVLAPS